MLDQAGRLLLTNVLGKGLASWKGNVMAEILKYSLVESNGFTASFEINSQPTVTYSNTSQDEFQANVSDGSSINGSSINVTNFNGPLNPGGNEISLFAHISGGNSNYSDTFSANAPLFSGSSANPTLSVGTFYLTDLGSYTASSAGDAATIVVSPACYARGTHVLTTRGEVSVEALAIGDTVVTVSGARRPVVWIGRRSYAGRFLAANPAVYPIRFCAGSLGNDLPIRDLLVSPEHAMFIDGILIPARCLVNGETIAQERHCNCVDYFHIELDSHDVLLAEGAPSETFVDDDSRGMFHNVVEWGLLYPGRERVTAAYCAPRIENGFELEVIRQRLAAVAIALQIAA